MLHARSTSPHPRARIMKLDTSKAEQMPGVSYVSTYRNSPGTYPLPQEFNFQGEYVAIVAAETEDLAEDAVAGDRHRARGPAVRIHAQPDDVSGCPRSSSRPWKPHSCEREGSSLRPERHGSPGTATSSRDSEKRRSSGNSATASAAPPPCRFKLSAASPDGKATS